MLALEMEQTIVKGFMGKLLREEIFDTFEARTVEIVAATRITIEGITAWAELRPMVYEIIKLSPKPKHMKIIFSHRDAQEIHINAAALFLNMVYENDSVTFTTASAQKEFALDKSIDIVWDEWIRKFLVGFSVKDRE